MANKTDPFTGILPFVHTAEEKSFRRAAARLGVTTAAVSKAVAKLEADLGVQLLLRSSRSVAVTPEGLAFLERCRDALASLEAGRELVADAQRIPQGMIKASISPIFGRAIVRSAPRLLARHPRLRLELSFTDRMVRLLEEDVDVAVRLGPLEDSTLVVRRLRSPRWVTLAAPAYLSRRGTPSAPEDLARHDCLRFVTPRGKIRDWVFQRDGVEEVVRTDGSVLVDKGDLLLDAAAAGLGVCQVLDFMADEHVSEGRLFPVLGDFAAEGPSISAVCAPRRSRTPRIRAFLDHLGEVLGQPPSGG